MSEVRQSMPYISFLRITKRITNKFVPNGQQNEAGQDLYDKVTDLPGIECAIVPYMGLIPGPVQPFRFLSKAFFEVELAKLQAKAEKTTEDTNSIANLQAQLANEDVIWVEQIIAAGELPSLQDLWVDVFSDALQSFNAWAEQPGTPAGIPLYPYEIQWEADVPFGQSKSIELKVGLYSDVAALTKPTIHTLVYEDNAAKTKREAVDAQLANRLVQINTTLAGLPAGPSPKRTQLTNDKVSIIAEQERRAAVQIGVLSQLTAHASVQQSLPVLSMAIIGILKAKYWPNLDMVAVQQRLGPALAAIA